jgi:hypothetical protein
LVRTKVLRTFLRSVTLDCQKGLKRLAGLAYLT